MRPLFGRPYVGQGLGQRPAQKFPHVKAEPPRAALACCYNNIERPHPGRTAYKAEMVEEVESSGMSGQEKTHGASGRNEHSLRHAGCAAATGSAIGRSPAGAAPVKVTFLLRIPVRRQRLRVQRQRSENGQWIGAGDGERSRSGPPL